MGINKETVRAAAQKYLQRGQLDKAIHELQRLVEVDPQDVRSLLKIGDLQTRKGDAAAATQTYMAVAMFYAEQHFFLKAVAVYKQVLQLDPSLIEVSGKLAALYQQLGLRSDALQQYCNVCDSHERTERWDACLDALDAMLRLDPTQWTTRVRRGEIYTRVANSEAACADFTQAARELHAAQKWDEYVRVGERLLQLDTEAVEMARSLAIVYLERHEPRHALAKLQICFRILPRDIQILGLMAQSFATLNQGVNAASVYRQLAELHAQQGETAAAQRCRTQANRLDPLPNAPSEQVEEIADVSDADVVDLVDDEADRLDEAAVETLLLEVDIYLKYGLQAKASAELQRILTQIPNHRQAQARYAELLIGTEAVPAALELLWKMAEQAVADGQSAVARGDLEMILTHHPSHIAARHLLRSLAPAKVEVQAQAQAQAPGMDSVDIELDDHSMADMETPLIEFALEDLNLLPSPAPPEAATVGTLAATIATPKKAATRDFPSAPDAAAAPEVASDFSDAIATTVTAIPGALLLRPIADTDQPIQVAVAQVAASRAAAQPAAVATQEDDLSAEIEELTFLVTQGLDEEAQEALDTLRTFYPDNSQLLALQARLQAAKPDPVAVVPAPKWAPDTAVQSATGQVDLAALMADDSAQTTVGQISFQDVFSDFKRGVAAQVANEDFDTHFNLGIAYKEMGLLDDALREFTLVSQSPPLEVNALTMVGLCHLERGSRNEALEAFMRGLSSANISTREVVNLRYEVGAAYEAMGRFADAGKFYERASDMDPTFRDLPARLANAQTHRNQGPAADLGELEALLGEGSPAPGPGKGGKVSYL